jgi:hypothetical protein
VTDKINENSTKYKGTIISALAVIQSRKPAEEKNVKKIFHIKALYLKNKFYL